MRYNISFFFFVTIALVGCVTTPSVNLADASVSDSGSEASTDGGTSDVWNEASFNDSASDSASVDANDVDFSKGSTR